MKTEIQVLDELGKVIHSIDVTGKSDRTVLRIVSGMEINLNPKYRITVVTSS